MTLTGFLLARIAEEEATFSASYREVTSHHPSAELDSDNEPWASGRRWLRECEAKRRIVEEVTTAEWRLGMPAATVLFVLQHLAAVYADHPDYREEWRP